MNTIHRKYDSDPHPLSTISLQFQICPKRLLQTKDSPLHSNPMIHRHQQHSDMVSTPFVYHKSTSM